MPVGGTSAAPRKWLIKLNDEQKVATIAIVAKTVDEIDEEFEDGFNEIVEENEQIIEVENTEE